MKLHIRYILLYEKEGTSEQDWIKLSSKTTKNLH